MDDTVLKIALAGLTHDIGKFAHRAGMAVSPEFLNSNAGLYQPYIAQENRHTHLHAVYTAAFFDYFRQRLPRQLNEMGWGQGDAFVNLAAGHHKPETPLQWIVTVADRISSGADRQSFGEGARSIPIAEFRETRLLAIFEQIAIQTPVVHSDSGALKYRYPLCPVSPEGIFPVTNAAAVVSPEEQYKKLFLDFSDDLQLLAHRNDSLQLWFDHFDSLLCDYLSNVPAATVGDVIHDVSLYDHARSTAAISAALYRFHADTNTMSVQAVKDDWQSRKFLLVSADFYGIQNFIFSDGGETAANRAKMLRGRSFMVSLLSELAAFALCEALGLPGTAVLLSAAGKFTILCHNTPESRETVMRISNRINDWLDERFFGETAIGISLMEASPDDFVRGNFAELWERLSSDVERKKYSRVELLSKCGAVERYLDSFNNLNPPLCPYCGKRPSVPDAMPSLPGGGERDSCRTCRDQVFLGTEIVKNDRIAIVRADADLRGDRKLFDPVYGIYQIGFATGRLSELARQDALLKLWQIRAGSERGRDRVTVRHIGGHVPTYGDEDFSDSRILEGRKSDQRKEELINQIERGVPKTFHHLAAKARVFVVDETGPSRGLSALGTLKADVDNLGLVFSCGIPRDRVTLSRFATLSRQMNAFFSIYVPDRLASSPEYRDIYTVFAGGDDLFLIGPWNRVIDFASDLNARFSEYTCRNAELTLSAGVSLHKPGEPLSRISSMAESALVESKKRGRNRLTLFGQTLQWCDLEKLETIRQMLDEWLRQNIINSAMLYRFNAFQAMAERERKIIETEGGISMATLKDCLWRPLFRYTATRNLIDKRNDIMAVADWIDTYAGRLRIPLWRVLYEHRKE